MEACATLNNVFMGAAIMGGFALIIGMILGYFRWFYSKTETGEEARRYANGC